MESIKKITFLGSGNLATQLSKAFVDKGLRVMQVFSRMQKNAEKLASQLGAEAVSNLQHLNDQADIYIVCVSDKVIQGLVRSLSFSDKILVHTSGSVDLKVLANSSEKYGVFYPLNTFSKTKTIDFSNTPFCIEAGDPETKRLLMQLAGTISTDVREINSEQRRNIHLAAVFASNFVNHMYAVSADILKKNDVSFDIMRPIVQEVAEKIKNKDPLQAHTGPALREDHDTLAKHLDLLKDFPDYQQIYQMLSNSIIKRHKKK